MKEFLRKYGLIILVCLLLTGVFSYSALKYKAKFNALVKEVETIMKGMEDGTIVVELEGYDPHIPTMVDGITLYFELLNSSWRYLIRYLPLAALLPSCYYLYKKLHSGMIRAELTRKSYKEFLKEHLKITYKSMLVFPIFIMISFLICFLITGRIDIWNERPYDCPIYESKPLNDEYIQMLPMFLILYVVNLTLLAGFYINIFLMFLRKKMPYLVSCMGAFLTILGINLFLEIIVGKGIDIFFLVLYKNNITLEWIYFHMNANLNTYMFWVPGDWSNSYIQFIIALTLFLGSGYLVYRAYKNKERLLVNYEL